MSGLAGAGATLLGGSLAGSQALAGGDLSEIVAIELTDGRRAVAKTGPAPRTEAAMLEAIEASGAPVPAVLAVDDSTLVISALPAGGGLAGAWGSLGTALKTLHVLEGDRYGWPEDYAFGSVRIENGWSDDWPSFWAERRLLAHLPHIPVQLGRRIEVLAKALPDRLPRRPRPSLLHGDLWTGNVMASNGAVSGLIDPACYHGDGEVDIAMLCLFGDPGPAFYLAYGPLLAGHEERSAIYTLWPALVHLRLFGDGYRGLVERQLTALGV